MILPERAERTFKETGGRASYVNSRETFPEIPCGGIMTQNKTAGYGVLARLFFRGILRKHTRSETALVGSRSQSKLLGVLCASKGLT